RSFLSELGCLSVSSMIHVPKAQDVFTEAGEMKEGQVESAWFDYFSQTFSQLVWWAEATHQHRTKVDPHTINKTFKTT
ncbi:hypothetical protein NE479_12630, partial [Phascolarctobacterium faecium]